MIDVDGIRSILKQSKIYVKENDKNFICCCPYCGDHKNDSKKGHFYVSKDESIPVCHCWLCLESPHINKLLFDLTGDKHTDLIKVENTKNYVKRVSTKKTFTIPELERERFPYKTQYIKTRTFNGLELSEIPNLIFDFYEFFRSNNLKIDDYIPPFEQQYVQDTMVGFLSKRHTLLYCRATSNDVRMKFKKYVLQDKTDDVGLDYYSIDDLFVNSNTVVLSEGNFDILGAYSLNTLNLKDCARVFASGCTFSYEELLKSVCTDYGIYRANVYILSDSDKPEYTYKKFIKNSSPYINELNIYYNQFGKDFGCFPQKAIKLFN